jgi:hypothetical protein
MPHFQYDLSNAQSDIFGRLNLPAKQVPIRLNGTTISVIDLYEDGMADLSLTSDTIERLNTGQACIHPYILHTGFRKNSRTAELTSRDISQVR